MAQGRSPREADQLLALLSRHSPDVIWMFDPDWTDVKFVGQAYEDVWGRPVKRLESDPRDFLNGVHPDDRERVRAGMDCLSNGQPVEGEYRVNAAENFGRTVWSKGEPVYDKTDSLIAVAGFVRDVTGREEDHVELERRNQRLTEFAGTVSHNLKNSLNVAQGHVSFLEEDCESEHLEPVNAALSRMDAIIRETLTLGQQGSSVDDASEVALAAVARSCWTMVETADASLEIFDDVRLRADPDRLRTIFENVFRNAIAHGGDGVTVRVGPLDDEGFYVADSGRGIPTPDREAVFEPGHTTSDDGTGLGLTIVRRIAEAHGWSVRMAESAEGGARLECTDVEIVRT